MLGGLPGSQPGTGARWVGVGPAPLRSFNTLRPDSGQVLDIAIDPRGQADQVIYIACNDGGIWKSTDAGDSWLPTTELMPSLSMGAVALDPSNPDVVYAGTGNPFDGGLQFSKGVGIYRSIDGGQTWSIVAGSLFAYVPINRIVVPAPGVLVVATSNGVYRSVDGGRHFGANAPAFDDDAPVLSGLATDLTVDTQVPTTVYACIAGQGVLVSTDAGATFPVNLFTKAGPPGQPYAVIRLAQSTQPDGLTLYASVSFGSGPTAGLFRSADAGATWTDMPAGRAAGAGAQFGYDQTVGVDPLDPNRVYLGFQQLHLSTDGGATFQATPVTVPSKVHEDHHRLVFSPPGHRPAAPPSRVYVATDGGIATSPDGGATWLNLNNGIATNLFVGFDIGRGSAASNGYSYGGTQDTGFPFRQPGFPGADWHMTAAGDGGQVAVDPANPRRAYGCTGSSFRTTADGGSLWADVASGLSLGASRVTVDPSNGANVYASAGSTLYQSTDHAAHFTPIRTFSESIRAIAVAPLDSNSVWVALDTALSHTSDALAGSATTWTPSTPGAPGWMVLGSIAIDPRDVDRVVVVYAGQSTIDPANRTHHVFQTADGGTTWTDIGGTDGGNPLENLPDLPLHSVVIDPGVTVRGLFGVRAAAQAGGKGQSDPLIAVGLDGIIVTSADSVLWTVQRSGTSATLVDAAWGDGQWVVVGLNGTILTSLDGVTWTAQDSHTHDALHGIAWSGSLFAVADASTANVLTSPDGTTWTVRPLGTAGPLLAIDWDGHQFVGAGYNGTIVTSPDGISWTARPLKGVSANLNAVTHGTVHVVAGQGGTVLTSPDAISWTLRSSGVTDQVDGVSTSFALFVAVLNTGGILTSPDGVTWTPRPSGTSARLLAVTWAGTQFVAVGDSGTILTSPDGMAWTPQASGSVPESVIVASDAGVMRTLDGGAKWHVPGVGLPAVDCKSLALDSSASPSLLRVGTYGRSVFELTAPAGPVLVVEANLGFGFVPVGSTATLHGRAVNVGSAGLDLAAFSLSTGSADFAIASGAAPASLGPGAQHDFSITFAPSLPGDSTATFRLDSTDPRRPVTDLAASGTGV